MGHIFFEQVRSHLSEKLGIISEVAFNECESVLDLVIEEHLRTADLFQKKQHPLLPYVLSYQDGLIHAFQRIRRKRKTGEYHSASHVHLLVHGYEHKYDECAKRHDYWNAAYARGYQNGLLFLLISNDEA